MIRQEDVFPVGRITKVHGARGEAEVHFSTDVFEYGDAPYVMVKCDGLLVPYFWEDYRYKNDSTALVQFYDINSLQTLSRLVGCQVYYPRAHYNDEEAPVSTQTLCGYHVADAKGKDVGQVTGVDASSPNVLLQVHTPEGADILLPFHENLLLAMDDKLRRLTLEIPDGLLNL